MLPHVVALDYGMKWNIARHLFDMGCRVTVLPGTATADDVLGLKPDGVFLSNGPGDPEPIEYAQEAIRDLLGKKPIFGICLGHQASLAGLRRKNIQVEIRPPGGQPTRHESRHRPSRNHLPEPRLRGGRRDTAGSSGGDPPQSQRSDDRRGSAPQVPGVQRAVSPGSVGGAARTAIICSGSFARMLG